MDKNNPVQELTPEAKRSVDNYLKTRIVSAAAILGFVNIVALAGLYTAVVDKVAENATKRAIVSTEQKLEGLTKQFDQLSTKTTEGLANALISIGEAKAKVNGINKDIIGLENLNLDHVKSVTTLLDKSSEEIILLVNATSEYQKSANELKEYRDVIGRNLGDISQAVGDISDLREGMKTNSLLVRELSNNIKLTNKWLIFSYDSASKHGIWTNSKGENHEVHIEWQKDHMSNVDNVKNDLK